MLNLSKSPLCMYTSTAVYLTLGWLTNIYFMCAINGHNMRKWSFLMNFDVFIYVDEVFIHDEVA